MNKLYKKYEEIINYLIVGVLTTLVSLGSKYIMLFSIFDAKDAFELQLSVIISWILAVAFAYFANRKYVFKSKEKNYLYEITTFVSGRLLTLGMEMLIMWFFITLLKLNTHKWVIAITILCQVLIMIFNYIISKLFVFNKKMNKLKTKEDKIVFAAVVVLTLILTSFFMYLGDDWTWGSSVGIDRLNSHFANYSGRYFSNLLIIIISRFNYLRIFFMSFIIIAIIYLIKKITNNKSNSVFLIYLLILAVPTMIFINTISWASGFVNYVFPVFMVLLILYNIKDVNNSFWELDKWWKNLLLCLLGFLSCLIVEHVTIYLVILSIIANIYSFIKYKKISKSLLMYSIGCILGACYMFSNGCYLNSLNGKDDYRGSTVSSGFINGIVDTYFNSIYRDFIFNNYILNIIICFQTIVISLKNKSNKIINCMSLFTIFYVLYTIIKLLNPYWAIFGNYTTYFEGIFTILYCLAILIIVLLSKNYDKNQKFKLAFILSSAVLITGPLLVVKPVTARCFFPSYIMLVLFIMQNFNYLNFFESKLYENINKVIIVVFLSYYTFWLSILSYNYITNARRNDYIHKMIEKGKTTIEIYELPYERYIGCGFGSYPRYNAFWQKNFKEFYGIDKNVKITIGNKTRRQLEKALQNKKYKDN